MEPLGIDGTWRYTPRIHPDDRGSVLEWFRASDLAAGLGYPMDIAQANCSVSRRGVLRGIHFADVPPGQAKYVSCVRGAILDVTWTSGWAHRRSAGGRGSGWTTRTGGPCCWPRDSGTRSWP